MNGAEFVTKILQSYGVDVIFGYPGGAIMPFYDAIYGSNLEHILFRNEQGAGFSALGYSRSSGYEKLGVVVSTSGPGATNLITPLADANLDSIPLIAITGQVSTQAIGSDAFQEVDVLGLSLSVTKHSFLVKDADNLGLIFAKAFGIALSPRFGPVLIDLPKDVQMQEVKNTKIYDYKDFIKPLPDPKKEDINGALELFKNAKKPLFYIGGGVHMARAQNSLNELLNQVNLPSVCTIKGLGITNHELNLGMLGMHGSRAANHAVHDCDLLIALGARFDDRVTGDLATFAPNARIIHCDCDKSEFGKNKVPDLAIYADLSKVLKDFESFLSDELLKVYKPWLAHILDMKQKLHFCYEDSAVCTPIKSVDENGAINPTLTLQILDKLRPKNSVITTDVGQHQMWGAQYLEHANASNFLTSSGLGTMGLGLELVSALAYLTSQK